MMESSRPEKMAANIQTLEFEPLIPGLPNDLAMECLLRVPITSHPTLRRVSHRWSSVISHPSFLHHRRQLGSTERLLFLLQPPPQLPLATGKDAPESLAGPPSYNLNVFNLSHYEWRRFDLPMPTFAQCVAVPSAGKVVVLGGWDPVTLEPVDRVLVLDLLKGTWKEGSPMPEKKSFFACAAVGETTIYVAGGHDGRKNALKSAAAYDVVSDQWKILPSMSEERDECHGLSFDGSKFWVISGYGTENQGRFRPDCEVFDPECGSWNLIDGLWPYPNAAPRTTTAAAGGRRWVEVKEGEVREFDWEERRWKSSNWGGVPKRVNGSSIMMAEVGDDGKIFVMGSEESCEGECENVECGGDGAFILERESRERKCENGNNEGCCGVMWKHVHAPSTFLGFPFSASNLLI